MNVEKNEEAENKYNKPVNFKQILESYKKEPKPKFLWNGIKENSMGLIFGPSKSGKTTFAENLAMNIAMGEDNYFGYQLPGRPMKVLFISLEEFWINRMERNENYYNSLNQSQRNLIDENYLMEPIGFIRFIHSKSHWDDLEGLIANSEAEVVIIDSITRMVNGKIEDAQVVEILLQRLKTICYNNKITLICIHHTPKMEGEYLTMDKIKGSSVFQQEVDFAIGINRTLNGVRYMKNVMFRYAQDDDEMVKTFSLDGNQIVVFREELTEYGAFKMGDRRTKPDRSEYIVDYLNKNQPKTFTTSELVSEFGNLMGIKERQIKNYLKRLVDDKKIDQPTHGVYSAIKIEPITELDNVESKNVEDS